MPAPHVITVIVNGQEISEWTSGNIESSMITAADKFALRMPLTLDAWNTLRRDSDVTIKADGITLLRGYIDRRKAQAKEGVLEIEGRDRAGRLADESAPAIDYSGLTVVEAVRQLGTGPHLFERVTLDNGRNRRLRRGRGRRFAAPNEPVVTINVRTPRRGRVHPGQSRWSIIHEIVSRAGLVCFGSVDGKELVICKPNQTQQPQYLFRYGDPGVLDMTFTEDDGDRFSEYLCTGSGQQGSTNAGPEGATHRGIALDNPFNAIDGTGRDFIHPKRMHLPERAFDSYGDAQRVAENEQHRRDYKRHVLSVEAALFGQAVESEGELTLFSPDTIARAVFDPLQIDDTYFVTECSFSFVREQADTTTLHMVPTGTEIVL